MSNEDKKTMEKILQTTVKLLSEGKINSLSIRNIAEYAGVNSASINYYFKSKENLIYEAALFANKNAVINITKQLNDKLIPPKERLYKYMTGYAEILNNFPEQSKFLINTLIIDKASSNMSIIDKDNLNFVNALVNLLSEIGCTTKNNEFKFLAIILNCSIVFPFLSKDYGDKYYNFDLKDNSQRADFMDFLFNMIIKQLEI